MIEKYLKRYRKFLLYGGYTVLPEKCFKVFELLSVYRWKYSNDEELNNHLKNNKLICVKPISELAEILGYTRSTIRSAVEELKKWNIIFEGKFRYKGLFIEREAPYYILGELEKNNNRKFIWYLEKFQLKYIESCEVGDYKLRYLDKLSKDGRRDINKLPENIVKFAKLKKYKICEKAEKNSEETTL